MSLFAIGDTHLSLSCDKPMDIFKGWDNYVCRLEENWNSVVSAEDTVVITGDISWAMTLEQAYADFEFINNRLNGRKIILKGNHDYWFETKSKCERFFLENGFDKISLLHNNAFRYGDFSLFGTRSWVSENGEAADKKVLAREVGRLKLSLAAATALGGEPIAFLHYPPVYYVYECKDILDVLIENNIKQCYYGHIHGSGHSYAVDGEYKGIQLHLVAGDYVDFTPVLVAK